MRPRVGPRRDQVAVAAFALASAACSLAAPIARATWIDYAVIRYVLPTLFVPFLLPCIGAWARFTRAALAAVLVAAVASHGIPLDDLRRPLVRQYAVDAAALDAVRDLARRGVRVGLAPYWIAKQIMVDVSPDIHVTAIGPDGVVSPWLANRDWLFEEAPQGFTYPREIIVVDDDAVVVDAPHLRAPKSTTQIGRIRIRVFAADRATFLAMVRDVCLHSFAHGVDCAPARGGVDLLPMLLEPTSDDHGLAGLDIALLGGTYVLCVDAPDVVGVRAELCERARGCHEHAVTEGAAVFDVTGGPDRARLALRWDRGTAASVRSVRLARRSSRSIACAR